MIFAATAAMSFSETSVNPDQVLDRIRADQPPEDIIKDLKSSKYGLLTLATALSQLSTAGKSPDPRFVLPACWTPSPTPITPK